jgi:hypothetical protein
MSEDNFYQINCPHCDISIQIEKSQLNCTIFRCGVYKNNINQHINPHLPKDQCEQLVRDGLIYGCAGPFKFDGNTLEKCDYI